MDLAYMFIQLLSKHVFKYGILYTTGLLNLLTHSSEELVLYERAPKEWLGLLWACFAISIKRGFIETASAVHSWRRTVQGRMQSLYHQILVAGLFGVFILAINKQVL
jgi:hypothetical protein